MHFKGTEQDAKAAHAGPCDRFPRVPEGAYKVRVRECCLRQDTKDETWQIVAEIIEGPFASSWLWDRLPWSPNFRWKQYQVLESLGFEVNKGLDIEANDLVGKTAEVTVIWKDEYTNISEWRGLSL